MCIDLPKTATDEMLLEQHQLSTEMYELAKTKHNPQSMAFWSNDIASIEKELAERGLLMKVIDHE